MSDPRQGFRIYRGVERFENFQVYSHVQCEHPP